MVAYYLYELAVHTLAFIVAGKKHHDRPRGCIFDFKADKLGILDSMKAGAICDPLQAVVLGEQRYPLAGTAKCH